MLKILTFREEHHSILLTFREERHSILFAEKQFVTVNVNPLYLHQHYIQNNAPFTGKCKS